MADTNVSATHGAQHMARQGRGEHMARMNVSAAHGGHDLKCRHSRGRGLVERPGTPFVTRQSEAKSAPSIQSGPGQWGLANLRPNLAESGRPHHQATRVCSKRDTASGLQKREIQLRPRASNCLGPPIASGLQLRSGKRKASEQQIHLNQLRKPCVRVRGMSAA